MTFKRRLNESNEPPRWLFLCLVDGEPIDLFRTEGQALDCMMHTADEMYGHHVELVLTQNGVTDDDWGESYDEVLNDIIDDQGNLQIERIPAKDLINAMGSYEDAERLVHASTMAADDKQAVLAFIGSM